MLAGVGVVVYWLWNKGLFTSAGQPSIASQIFETPGASLYNAITGEPTESQITPAYADVYMGPNAPPDNQGMYNFLKAGGDPGTVIPNVEQTPAELYQQGYSWDEITQLWTANGAVAPGNPQPATIWQQISNAFTSGSSL